ncbi:carbohydrate sulfotransferase 11-like [Patiria miniata]|uniref:Carbohydrate sulfotransferase n=1 Tax=Patiria miniata TaxID=46514 RepID=A0A914B896_PATMI|nr:carbohydrate sulfotransferase 11-like [Patiria miniata]
MAVCMQPARRLGRMIGNKRIFVCCVFLTLAAVVYFVVKQPHGYPMYSGRILQMSGKGLDLQDTRQLFTLNPPDTNHSRSWEDEQVHRRKLISDTCRAAKKRSKDIYPRLEYDFSKVHSERWLKFLLVVDSLKMVYCYVPKVGTTSWKRLLLVLEGRVNSTEELGQKKTHNLTVSFMRNLNSYTPEEAKWVLTNYKKFLFVRNPFERILSAYQDKFQNDYPASKIFRTVWSEMIIRYSGGDLSEARQRRQDGTLNVTFPQFARFVADSNSLVSGGRVYNQRNEHWMEAYRVCHPCAIDYDWVGHYDSMHTDADRILRAVGVDTAVRFPNFTTNPTGSSSYDTLRRYYSQLSTEEIVAIYRNYILDFTMFGFDIPEPIKAILG